MDPLTEGPRSGLRQEAASIAALGDRDRAIQHVALTRRRWAGVGSLVAVLLLVGLSLAFWHSAAVEPADPTPGPSAVTSGGMGSPLQVGRHDHSLGGPRYVRDVEYDVPTTGWRAYEGQGLLEVASPAGNGVGVLYLPSLVGFPALDSSPDGVGGTEVLAALQGSAEVEVVDSGTTTRGGNTFTWMDLTVAPEANLSDTCRLQAPCLPLVTNYGLAIPALELHADQVSRLFFPVWHAPAPIAFWILDTTGADAAAVIRLADGLTMGEAY